MVPVVVVAPFILLCFLFLCQFDVNNTPKLCQYQSNYHPQDINKFNQNQIYHLDENEKHINCRAQYYINRYRLSSWTSYTTFTSLPPPAVGMVKVNDDKEWNSCPLISDDAVLNDDDDLWGC